MTRLRREPVFCPYGLHTFLRRDVRYRCVQWKTDAGCRDLVPPGRWGRVPKCLGCDEYAVLPMCPRCEPPRELPVFYLDVPLRICALVGPPASGKSTYLAVLLSELRGQLGESLGMWITACDDITNMRFSVGFHRDLYQRGQVLAGTESARAFDHDARPLIFQLALPRRRWLPGRRPARRRIVNLVLYDTAGEDGGRDEQRRFHAFLRRVHGLMLFVDPTQLQGSGVFRDGPVVS